MIDLNGSGVARGDARYGSRANDATEKCFACGKPLGANPSLADTRDGQTAHVGSECMRKIEAAGETGWQPPRGGPKLYPLSKENASAPVGAMHLLFEDDYAGRTSIPVSDVRDASDKYRAYVEKYDLGSSEISFGQVVVGGKKVAEVSYNGRVVLENRG